MLDHDGIERHGFQAIARVLLGLGGAIVLILGFSKVASTSPVYLMLDQGERKKGETYTKEERIG
jgi:hypothetical protein